jgi:hypothetical protein
MKHPILRTLTDINVASAEIDAAQLSIQEYRLAYPSNSEFQKKLDDIQADVDANRRLVTEIKNEISSSN